MRSIVGGEEALLGELPFVAKILYGGSRVGCTGSLIAPDKVLTAGHCVSGYNGLSVGFGNTRASGPRYQVSDMILHPEYSTQVNDVAILQLEAAVTSIQPVHVLTLEEELRYAPSGGLGTAVGWGGTHPSGSGGLPGTLQTITNIPIYTATDCRRVLEDLRRQGKEPQPPSIHEKVLCAGEENRGTGNGDSGGPLLVETPDGWAQVGVLSQATRDPSPQTVVYMAQWTRTSYFLDWIFPVYRLQFAHSVSGDGWATDLVLINTDNKKIEATLQVFGTSGVPRLEEVVAISAGSVLERRLPGVEGVLQVGGITVSSSEKLFGYLRMRNNNRTFLSVQPAPSAGAFAVPISPHVDRVGVAVYNAGDRDSIVSFHLGGKMMDLMLPANGSVARFVDEYFTSGSGGANIMTVRGSEPVVVLGLEMAGSSFAVLPAAALR